MEKELKEEVKLHLECIIRTIKEKKIDKKQIIHDAYEIAEHMKIKI